MCTVGLIVDTKLCIQIPSVLCERGLNTNKSKTYSIIGAYCFLRETTYFVLKEKTCLNCTAPEMIPTPKWSPTLKWSPNRPRNDPDPEMIPTFLLVDPEMIPKELWNGGEAWDCGLIFRSLLKCSILTFLFIITKFHLRWLLRNIIYRLIFLKLSLKVLY